jgi:hypothetical protein
MVLYPNYWAGQAEKSSPTYNSGTTFKGALLIFIQFFPNKK